MIQKFFLAPLINVKIRSRSQDKKKSKSQWPHLGVKISAVCEALKLLEKNPLNLLTMRRN
jgi:hypothetical protein